MCLLLQQLSSSKLVSCSLTFLCLHRRWRYDATSCGSDLQSTGLTPGQRTAV